MTRSYLSAFVLIVATIGPNPAVAQHGVSFKSFSQFKDLVEGVDFFASTRRDVSPFEKPVFEAREKLKTLFGSNLPSGAIFICSTLEQKDSIYEPKVLKAGYGWTLTALTSAARTQEMLTRLKSQTGGEIPEQVAARLRSRPPEMVEMAERQMVSSTVQQMVHATLQSMLAKNLQFRSSRLDDMSRSPLPDWLDIGISYYATGGGVNFSYLQQHMEEAFPIEDVLSMSRPFVASYADQGGGGEGMMMRSGGGPGVGAGGTQGSYRPGGFSGNQSAFGGAGGLRGGGQRVLPKDQQDRMLFDSQAGTFFVYLVEKVGIDKVNELILQGLEGKESREFVTRPDVLGNDVDKIEADWADWVRAQKR